MPAWLSRPFLTALFALPLLAVVLLSAPAWLSWPFLPPGRQDVVLAVLDRLVQWTRASGAAGRAVAVE
ncbi:hypothetical protein PUR71_02150 [Streptomyces sp. SP17BM10]|uniref:hypothetical protein n=1 Tax=Streptomyces sp. SP17BM10 TaxID=3002530 RepID=UPI002E7903B1|nr:hypothetical protein [Streptomyces sp. SP17BM10]MEE1781740.1 hypothetical protein [Streptomyces sp. SP17BM10]